MATVCCKTAPALLQDILNFDPRAQASTCNHAYSCTLDRSHLQTLDEVPDKDTHWSVVALCQHCRCHVELNIKFQKATKPCPSHGVPLHHFRQTKTFTNQHLDPVLSFECSNSFCCAHLQASVRQPVLEASEIINLTDEAVLDQKYRSALQLYDGVTLQSPYSALDTLLKWVEGCLHQNSRSILARNKRLMTVLGEDAKPLLEKLGFSLVVEPDASKNAWRPPDITAAGGHWASLLLDVRDELQLLISYLPFANGQASGSEYSKKPYMSPPSTRELERILATLDYDKCPVSQRHPQNVLPYTHLGALPDFSDELVLFCYERQKACVPSDAPWLFDHLRTIVEQRRSEILQTKYTLYQSGGETSLSELQEAFETVGVKYNEAERLSDETVADRFKARRLDVGADTRARMRQALGVIAHFRQSTYLAQIAAANQPVTYQDALEALGLSDSLDDSWIQSAYVNKVGENPESQADLRQAVELIAQERKRPEIRAFLDFEEGAPAASVEAIHEACALLEISDLDAVDEDSLSLTFQIRLQEAGLEQQKALRQALTAIARHRNSNRLQSLLQDLSTMQSHSAPRPVEHSEPRGIRNIGNTCYLNSLLQYFFSLRPVRDLVLNFDQYRDDPTSASVRGKKVVDLPVGKHQIERAHKFINALQALFDALIHTSDTYVTPEVELAILTMENAVKEERRRRSTITRPNNSQVCETGSPNSRLEEVPSAIIDSPVSIREEMDPSSSLQERQMSIEEQSTTKEPVLDPTKPPLVPPRPETSKEAKLKETIDRYVHNEQQDVNEVADNVLHQLRWAIKAHGIDEDGEQVDNISELFYGRERLTTITGTGDKIEKNVQHLPFLALITRLIAVDGQSANLYQLLDDHFDRDWIVDSKDRYQFGAIISAPPILHVMVSVVDEHQNKVNKKVLLDQEIYMDRYMDNEAALSKKEKSWDLKDRLAHLRNKRESLKESGVVPKAELSHVLHGVEEWVHTVKEGSTELGIDTSDLDAGLSKGLIKLRDRVDAQLQDVEREISDAEHSLKMLFHQAGSLRYRLHAVFVHRGTGVSGHWWIFIRDPVSSVWRKYNDETVEVVQQTHLQAIFEYDPASPELGSPSLVIYVRDDSVNNIIPTVWRTPIDENKQ